MSEDTRPWIDIGTLSIARLMVTEGMTSFLDHFEDRADFRLRWIYHLDTYPWEGLESHFTATLAQAGEMAQHFDDALVMASWGHSGFGGSLLRVLREVRNPFMSIEDDFRWIRDFRLGDIIARQEDYVNFKGTPCGSISPSYWSPRMVGFMRTHFPEPAQHVTARDLMRICRGEPSLKWTEYTKKERNQMRHQHFEHLGDEKLSKLGVKKYGPLRYYWDSEKRNLVKVQP